MDEPVLTMGLSGGCLLSPWGALQLRGGSAVPVGCTAADSLTFLCLQLEFPCLMDGWRGEEWESCSLASTGQGELILSLFVEHLEVLSW